MDSIIYGNTLTAWAIAAVAAIALASVLLLARSLLCSRLKRFAARSRNHVDDTLFEVVRATRTWFLLGAAVIFAANLLLLPQLVDRVLNGLAVLGFVVQAGLWGNILIKHVVNRQITRRMQDDAASAMTFGALGFVARVLLWSVLLLLGLDNLGVNVTALVAGLGVGGIAVALAVQNILGDLFASMSIVLDKPFVTGDFIVVGDLMGSVEHIGLKTTRIRSLHGEQIVFSNNDLLGSRIRNYKRMQERRVVFTFGVTYDTPPQKVAAIPAMIRDIIESQPDIRFDRAHFGKYGEFALEFEVVYYVLDPDYNRYMDIQQAVNLEILHRFAAENILFALPTQRLHVTVPRNADAGLAQQQAISR